MKITLREAHLKTARRRWTTGGGLLAFGLFTSSLLQAAPTGPRVGIYADIGAESSSILALFRAVASIGDLPMAITTADIQNGRLTRANFDVLIILLGQDGEKMLR